MPNRGLGTALLAAVLLLTAPAAAHAAFPGLNGRIAYEAGDSVSGIQAVLPDGTDRLELTPTTFSGRRGTSVGAYDPAYSADGERIVFEKVEQGVFRPDVWVMNADGTGQTNLTGSTVSDRERDPSFSPDGSLIVYVREPDGGSQSIVVMSSAGSAPTDLTSSLPVTSPGRPEFSPDGTKIAFDASAGTDQDVYVMNANGTGLTNVTSAVAGSSSDPSWSPDGARIAFTHYDGMGRSDIFVIGASGGATTNLTSALVGTSVNSPAFSPDGSRIAYARMDGTDTDIFTMGSADGLGQTNLTTADPSFNGNPNWGPTDASAPKVRISKGPKPKTGKPTAKFEFAADEANVSFECKLTGKAVGKRFRKFKACDSPRTYRRLQPGKKRFEVRAADGAGNIGKPAKRTWKVLAD